MDHPFEYEYEFDSMLGMRNHCRLFHVSRFTFQVSTNECIASDSFPSRQNVFLQNQGNNRREFTSQDILTCDYGAVKDL